jgi:hypothetical protein
VGGLSLEGDPDLRYRYLWTSILHYQRKHFGDAAMRRVRCWMRLGYLLRAALLAAGSAFRRSRWRRAKTLWRAFREMKGVSP